MISDEPDEDADTLDDEGLLETYLGQDTQEKASGAGSAPKGRLTTSNESSMQDWPPAHPLDLDLDVDALAWFKTNHADWRSVAKTILRAWIGIRTRS